MTYLVDGHNLIPKIPGLSLKTLDDEMDLIRLLQVYCRLERKKAEVYFDNAPPGQASTAHYGTLIAHFVRQGTSADEAISTRLRLLGGEAQNWTVVTSDRQVQSEARHLHASVVSADIFARQLVDRLRAGDLTQPDTLIANEGEIEYWLHLFGGDG